MTVLVDTDVLVEVSRGRDHAIMSRWVELSESDDLILYSPVTAAELWAGVLPHEHDSLDRMLGSLLCAPIDMETGRQAGDYMRQYRRSHRVELGDALIAAAAVLNRALLWTRNRKHFPMKQITFY